MKIITKAIWLLVGVLLPTIAEGSDAPNNWPPGTFAGTLLGVMRGADNHTLVIHYEIDGHTNQQPVILTNDIADYHFCPWLFGRGVALAVSDRAGDVYWAVYYFGRLGRPVYPRKIRSPSGYHLVGIANTRGDTIVITAIDHTDSAAPRGWMYINECPPAADVFMRGPTNEIAKIQIAGFDHLLEFEVPTKKPAAHK